MKAARFPATRDLARFDFGQSRVDAALVKRMHNCQFLDSAQNVVLIGGPARQDSSRLAIGIEAILRYSKRVRFFSTVGS